jgi:hypothetical protein
LVLGYYQVISGEINRRGSLPSVCNVTSSSADFTAVSPSLRPTPSTTNYSTSVFPTRTDPSPTPSKHTCNVSSSVWDVPTTSLSSPFPPPCGEMNLISLPTFVTHGAPHLPTNRHFHVSAVVKHTPPSSPPTLLDPISSPPPFGSGHTPPSLSPRPFFVFVVKAAHYLPITTIPLPFPTFRTWTVVVPIAPSP